jgi:hypothetical protein
LHEADRGLDSEPKLDRARAPAAACDNFNQGWRSQGWRSLSGVDAFAPVAAAEA